MTVGSVLQGKQDAWESERDRRTRPLKGRTRPRNRLSAPQLLPAAIFALATLALTGCYHPPRALDQQAAVQEMDEQTPQRVSAQPRPETSPQHSGLKELRLEDGVTADEVVTLALLANPDLRAFRREREIAEAQVVAVSAIANPSLRLELLHIQEGKPRELGWGVTLQWTPPQPGVYSARKAQAKARVEEVRQEVFEREWEIASAVRLAHSTALEIERQKEFVDKAVELRRRLAETLQDRVSRGASTQLELSMATLALARAEQERADLDARYIAAVLQLTGLLGVITKQPLKLQEGGYAVPEVGARLPDSQRLASQAVANRPLFRAAAARYEQLAQALKVEEAKRWPWITLSSMPRYRHNDTSSHPNDFGVGVDVTLPVFDRNTGNIAAAEAGRLREQERFQAAVAAVRRETALACAQVEMRAIALKRFQETILPTLQEQERILDTAFQGQHTDLVTLLAAQDAVLRIRREYLEVRLLHQKAWLDLSRTVGALVVP